MTTPRETRHHPDRLRPGIRLEGLSKAFKTAEGTVHAVDGIDITIAPGETVALLGPNGAGKSTTIDMLLGLLPPDAGSVSIFGRSPADAIAAGAVGAMLQIGAVLKDLTVSEMLAMMHSLYPSPMPVAQAMEFAGITELANRRTEKLSGGQTQRVRFAVAMISNPDLIVLDEPTVALDVEARREFWTTMRHFTADGKTVIFATHYLEEADAYADRIILMAKGNVVADGPATEIKAMVGARTIRATLTGVEVSQLTLLPGANSAERHGEAVSVSCSDSDSALRALLSTYPQARDIEVTGAGLEQAFLQLTGLVDDTEGAQR